MAAPYIGRFAPSPTGPMHAGSLVAALASYLDAKVHGGQWLVRIEDVDEGRSVPGAAEGALDLLQRLGTAPDGSAIYPGTCRHGLAEGKSMRSLRLRVPEAGEDGISFIDRFAGPVEHHLALDAGDFVLKRADGYWAYQIAVVVDDALQGVTDVVRGADLLDSTPRQIYLQRVLGLPTPRYLHVPVVKNALGEKLSKQTGALAVQAGSDAEALAALQQAARALTLDLQAASLAAFWQAALPAWERLLL